MEWSLLGAFLGSLLATWTLVIVALWALRPRDVSLGELLGVIPDVLRLVRRLVGDRTIQLRVRIALVLLLGWLVSPVDVIPEFIPVIGPLDDVIVAVLVLRYVERQLGGVEFERRWPGTRDGYRLLHRVLHPRSDG